jgi:hypothetical protein
LKFAPVGAMLKFAPGGGAMLEICARRRRDAEICARRRDKDDEDESKKTWSTT